MAPGPRGLARRDRRARPARGQAPRPAGLPDADRHQRVRDDLYRACRDAGTAAYSPHDLRHRRISLWVAQGFDAVAVKTWAGHARASMSLDVYSHVVIDPAADEWRGFWREAYTAERSPGVVSVWSETAEKAR